MSDSACRKRWGRSGSSTWRPGRARCRQRRGAIALLAFAFGCSTTPTGGGPELRDDATAVGSLADRFGSRCRFQPAEGTADGSERPTRFVRCRAVGLRECSLETAIVTYTDEGGATVGLVAAFHTADREHFRRIEDRLADYEVVLYEGWRDEPLYALAASGTSASEPTHGGGPPAASATEPFRGLMRTLVRGSSLLSGGLEWFLAFRHVGQWSGVIDYSQPRFVNADMTREEFARRAEESREGLTQAAICWRWWHGYMGGALARLAGRLIAAPDVLVRPQEWHQAARILYALEMSEMNHSLSWFQLDEDCPPNVTIHERNALVERVLAEKLASGARRIAIYYGVVHMPDFECRLLARGFRKTNLEWIGCWAVRGRKPAARDS